ncbi:general substrate transporter [Hypoxylon trugodes]|uniref:general substrate transporter n=1 Tax=Hypoxylon trugodes TaxID=326681 RepID=UPI00218EB838|nr:general substrate transporter [Hypoxylon trugodes]KAI1390436.1 general substrate transporter [Hypoxylon trugodes]
MAQQRGHLGNSFRSLTIAMSISLAGLLYGLDTGIIASTIAQDSFTKYFFRGSKDNSIINGGIICGYYAGCCVGSAISTWSMDTISRRWSVLLGAFVSIVGAIIQATSQNIPMIIVGRAFSGFSTGMVYSVAPVYLSELAPPENRGFLVGLKGLMNTAGYLVAGWIGYAGSFAQGDLQWRIPLAMQAPPAALLALLTFALPYSPRWCKLIHFSPGERPQYVRYNSISVGLTIFAVLMKERYEDARKVMYYLHEHRGPEFIEHEYAEMSSQIRLETTRKSKSPFVTLFTRRYILRTLLGCLIVNMAKLSGSNVIQNYQSIMYKSLGFQGREVLLITALYGLMGMLGQLISIFTLSDHWPRRRTVIWGEAVIILTLSILTPLSKEFPDDHNLSGSRAGVAFIFLYAFFWALFFNSAIWVIVSEIYPLELRATGVGFAMFTQSVTAIWLSFAASIAFDRIQWRFYFVFIAMNVFALTVYYIWLPETNQLTLEEIAAKFGDVVSEPVVKSLGDVDGDGGQAAPKEIAKSESSEHVEFAHKGPVPSGQK